MSGEELAKTFISHQPFGFRPIEVNTNNYFLSGHPAARIIGIAGFGRPGEPGAFQEDRVVFPLDSTPLRLHIPYLHIKQTTLGVGIRTWRNYGTYRSIKFNNA